MGHESCACKWPCEKLRELITAEPEGHSEGKSSVPIGCAMTRTAQFHFSALSRAPPALKKEEENRRMFTEQAKKKDEEVKRLTSELE